MQTLTHEWWNDRRALFELFVSQLVVQEASGGDADAAERRLELIAGLPSLDITDAVKALADALIQERIVPPSAPEDVLHVAAASIHGMDYLLTWNCKHIANASLRKLIDHVCEDHGCEPPTICTPIELRQEIT